MGRRDRDPRDPRRRGRGEDDVVPTDRDAFQLCSANVVLMMTPRGVADVNVYTPERVEPATGSGPTRCRTSSGSRATPPTTSPASRDRGQDRQAADRAVRLARGGDRHADEPRYAAEEHHRVRRPGADVEGAATMRRDLDLDFDPSPDRARAPDRSQLREMFRRYEFRGLLNRIDDLEDADPAAAPAPVAAPRAVARGRAAAGARPGGARGRGRPLRARAGGRRRRRAVGRGRAACLRDAELVAHDFKSLPRLTMRPSTTRSSPPT